jgi:hypothetical protein
MKYDEMTHELFNRFNAKCLWSEKGPPNTSIETIEAFACRGRVVIAQKYVTGGWEIYAPVSDSLHPQTNLEALEKRLSDKPHEIQIDLEGGVIHDVSNIPHNVHVKIRDFDIDGVEPERIVENGVDPYVETIWIGGQTDVTVSDEATFTLSQPKT